MTVFKSPLDETHKRLGTTFNEQNALQQTPAFYTDALSEYRLVRDGSSEESATAGLIDFSSRGRIKVSGGEAIQFLNGLITNDVKALQNGAIMTAAFPTVQGRLIALARVIHLDDFYLIETESETRERAFQTLERFTLAGDFRVEDMTNETAMLSLQGAGSEKIIREALGVDASEIKPGGAGLVSWNEQQLILWRVTHTSEDGFDVIVSADHAPALWEEFSNAGASPFGFDALEILRIEAGLARYGVDMDETNVVLEAAPEEAVSFTKGCYVGQEIIARIHWRGHVAKKLTGLLIEDNASVQRNDKIRSLDGKEIGRLTSVTFSPHLERTIALGYVKYDYLVPGTEVRIASGEGQTECAAHVHDLPFVRGSWREEKESVEQ